MTVVFAVAKFVIGCHGKNSVTSRLHLLRYYERWHLSRIVTGMHLCDGVELEVWGRVYMWAVCNVCLKMTGNWRIIWDMCLGLVVNAKMVRVQKNFRHKFGFSSKFHWPFVRVQVPFDRRRYLNVRCSVFKINFSKSDDEKVIYKGLLLFIWIYWFLIFAFIHSEKF